MMFDSVERRFSRSTSSSIKGTFLRESTQWTLDDDSLLQAEPLLLGKSSLSERVLHVIGSIGVWPRGAFEVLFGPAVESSSQSDLGLRLAPLIVTGPVTHLAIGS